MITPGDSKNITTPAPTPVTSRTMQVVVFKLVNELYALPISPVREVLRMQPITSLPRLPAFVEGVVSLRGHIITVIDLRALLSLPRAEHSVKTRILIVKLPKTTVGFIVDGVQEVASVSRSTDQSAAEGLMTRFNSKYLSGIARLGQNLVILLDLATLFSNDQMGQLGQAIWQKSS